MNDVFTLNYDYLDKGLAQDQTTAFWKVYWENRKDQLCLPDFPLQLRYRMTCSAFAAIDGLSPPLIAIGRKSFAVDCFGEDWIQSSAFPDKTPDEDLERLVAPGYHAAIQGSPSLDIVQTSTSDLHGRAMRVMYERLIVPVRVGKYKRVLCCMTAPVKPIEWLPMQA
ncbi:hypothetical protein [Roseibium sediminis]|uniref:hypothetical protein n=1 Tax=Roseibium sediminis TaxID=1775174 RepID=UPI00123DCEFC|nr:hypothetical protein [Roseibium sediminis]